MDVIVVVRIGPAWTDAVAIAAEDRVPGMGKHEEPKPQPDPTRDGASPGRPVPDREPGKHEKK